MIQNSLEESNQLRIDSLAEMDHVSAYRVVNQPNQQITHPNHSDHPSIKNKNSFINTLTPVAPIPCNKFRTLTIINKLKAHFRDCWAFEKNKSIKLSLFYNFYKTSFTKEPYLDLVTNPAFRYRTTRLRVSSHDLEIEKGRYTNTPRNERICKWCSLTLGEHLIESEQHFLYSCDLYSKHRACFISNLSKLPEFIQKTLSSCKHETSNFDLILDDTLNKVLPSEFICTKTLPEIIRNLQSPGVYSSAPDSPDNSDFHSYLYNYAYHIHPQIQLFQTRTDINQNDKLTYNKLWTAIRTYTQNVMSTYIGRCFDERWKFLKELKKQPKSDCLPTDTN